MKFLLPKILSDNKISQKDLADAIGVPKQNISYTCKEAKSINFDLLEGICNVLDCTPNDLFELESGKDYTSLTYTNQENKENSPIECSNLEEFRESIMDLWSPQTRKTKEVTINRYGNLVPVLHAKIEKEKEKSDIAEKYSQLFELITPYIRDIANDVFDERNKDDTE